MILFHFRIVLHIIQTSGFGTGLDSSTDVPTAANYNSTDSLQESYTDEIRAWTAPTTNDAHDCNNTHASKTISDQPRASVLGHISKEFHSAFLNTMWHFLVPVVSLVGMFGNICGVWYILHEKMVRQPFHLYLLALMFTDLVFLLLSVVRNALIFAEYHDHYLADMISCRYSTRLRHTQSTVYNSCALLITLMALERLVNIMFPLRVKLFSLRGYTIGLITFVTVFTLVTLWPVVVQGMLVEKYDVATNKTICVFTRSQWDIDNADLMSGYTLCIIIFMRICPAVVTLVSNVILVVYLTRQRRIRQALFDKKTDQENKINLMLFVLSACLVLSLIPTTASIILTRFYRHTYGSKGEGYYTQQFIRDFAYLMRVISSANDFFVYILISKTSRNTFRGMILCCGNLRRENLGTESITVTNPKQSKSEGCESVSTR